jgi:hypothetical protein
MVEKDESRHNIITPIPDHCSVQVDDQMFQVGHTKPVCHSGCTLWRGGPAGSGLHFRFRATAGRVAPQIENGVRTQPTGPDVDDVLRSKKNQVHPHRSFSPRGEGFSPGGTKLALGAKTLIVFTPGGKQRFECSALGDKVHP